MEDLSNLWGSVCLGILEVIVQNLFSICTSPPVSATVQGPGGVTHKFQGLPNGFHRLMLVGAVGVWATLLRETRGKKYMRAQLVFES